MINITWFLGLFALIVIGVIMNNLEKPLTPNLYVFNTYMYILLAIIIVATTWTTMDNLSEHYVFGSNGFELLGLFIMSLLLLLATTTSRNNTMKNSAWVLFIVTIGLMTHIQYKTQKTSEILKVFLSLCLLVLVFAWISYNEPLEWLENWYNPMMLGLLGLIIVQVIDLAFFYNSDDLGNFLTRFRLYSWVGLILFLAFLLRDTKELIKNSHIVTNRCITEGWSQSECANYPTESLNIFLDITNLFTSASNLS